MSSSTVILGAGIIGVSTAYYLSKHQPPSTIHLVEPSPELFASASGYAGGFLAKDWFPSATAELGALSFEEHRKLAEKEGGAVKWGYSRSTSISLSPATDSKKSVDLWFRDGASRAEASRDDPTQGIAPPWLRTGKDDMVEVISQKDTVAQLDPLQLSQFLLKKCVDAGVQLHHPAQALLLHTDVRGEVSSIRIADTRTGSETDVPCARVVVAAGSWSPVVFRALFPRSPHALPISSLAGHSLVVRSPRWAGGGGGGGGDECHAVFLTSQPGYSPEIFSRAGGHIYVAGLNSATEPLPPLATDAKKGVAVSAIQRLRETARELLLVDRPGREGDSEQAEDDLEVVREGLCFRPVTESGLPIIGRISDEILGMGIKTRVGQEGGVYIAAGHGPWGISLSLGTGKVLAEMMQGRELSADVSALGLKV